MDARALRASWERDEAVVGPFVQLAAPAVVEIMALAGFDLVNVDLEHGPYGVELAEQMVRAADARGIPALVRVAANRPELIGAALESGAAGVLVPHVEGVADARAVVAATRFHPQGERGLGPTARSADYSAAGGAEYFARANASVLAGVLIEGAGAYDELDGILALDGLDLVMVAPYDLSQSLGVPGEVTHPRVVATIEDVCARVARAGKVVGMFSADPRAGAEWIRRGVRYLGLDIDVQLPAAGRALREAGCELRVRPRASNRTPYELVALCHEAVAVIADADPFDASVFARAGAAGDRADRRGPRLDRPRRRARGRRRRRGDTGDERRDGRRPRARADAGRAARAPAAGCAGARRRLARLRADAVAAARGDRRADRLRRDRPRGRAPRARLRRRAGRLRPGAGGGRRGARRARRAARAQRRRERPRTAERGDARAARRRRDRPHEAGRRARQHRPRPDRRGGGGGRRARARGT